MVQESICIKSIPLFETPKTGKEHSFKYEEHEIDFAKFLRANYYNTLLYNRDIADIKAQWQHQDT